MSKRRYALSKAGADAAAIALQSHFAKLPEGDAERIARDVMSAYFKARREDDLKTRHWGQDTWLLAGMEVGHVRYFSGMARRILHQRLKGARHILGEPKATWRMETIASGEIMVVRLANGARILRDPLRNPRVREIVAIPVGHAIISQTVSATRGAGALDVSAKSIARRHLGDDQAQWAILKAPGGIQITRTR